MVTDKSGNIFEDRRKRDRRTIELESKTEKRKKDRRKPINKK